MSLSSLFVPFFKSRSREITRSLFRSREKQRDANQRLKQQLKDSELHRQRLVKKTRSLEFQLAQQAKEQSRFEHEIKQLRNQPCQVTGPPVPNHGFDAKMISMCVELAKAIGFRPVETVLQIVQQWLGAEFKIPQWTTVRTWSCRCGIGYLEASAIRADDWIWMIDHSVQLAQENVLLILGIRQADLPTGRPLRREDMSVLAIVPGDSRDKASVAMALESLADEIGVPISIVVDGARELHEGIKIFEEKRKQMVLVLDDIKHKAANILKHTLGKDSLFKDFESKLGRTSSQIQQTELAQFLPPKRKSKCRFMSLLPLLKWQRMVQHHLKDPGVAQRQGVTRTRLREKLDWVEAFAEPAKQWRQCQAVVSAVLRFSNRQGVCRGATEDLKKYLENLDLESEMVQQVYSQLIEAYWQCERRLLASDCSELRMCVSTEVLESTLGGFKRLQRQHTRGGFTSLLAALPTLMSKQTPEIVTKLLTKVTNKKWKKWVADSNLARSTHAKKIEAYRAANLTTGINSA